MTETVKVIDRVFDILEYLSLAQGQRGPTDDQSQLLPYDLRFDMPVRE